MSGKTLDLMWSLSLTVIGVATLILAVSNIIGAGLPDILTRILGIADLIALPFLIFSTVKKAVRKSEGSEK